MGEMKVAFEKTADYRVRSATGAWGGVTPNGDVLIDFYIERFGPPAQLTMVIDPLKVTEKDRIGEVIVRELQAGFLLRADIAHSIGSWLIAKAEEAGFSGVQNVS